MWVCLGLQHNKDSLLILHRKHVPCFYQVIETQVEIWENEKFCGNTSRRRVFPQLFEFSQTFTSVSI